MLKIRKGSTLSPSGLTRGSHEVNLKDPRVKPEEDSIEPEEDMRHRMTRSVVAASGFTIFELIITLSIAVMIAAAIIPGYSTWVKQRSFQDTYKELSDTLLDARFQALSAATASFLRLQRAGDIYTLSIWVSDAPLQVCDGTGNWAMQQTTNLNIHQDFQITGTGIGDTCFYRDGSSSGATYTIAQKDGGTEVGAATMTIIMATGFIDVTSTN